MVLDSGPFPAAPQPAPSSHDRILAAAKQLFASRGYENTSTVAIARAAGTSESQLIKHFGSKEGLLEAIFDQGWGRMAYIFRAVQDLPSAADKLNAILDLMLNALDRDPELKQLMLMEGRRIRKEGHMVVITAGFLQFVKVVDAVLTEMKAQGELVEDLGVEAVRSALIGMFEGLLRDQVLAQRVGYNAPYGAEELRRLFQVVLRGFTVKAK
jgi:AcrR family transcriptional regulator